MTSVWWGVARSAVVVAAGAGLTYAAMSLPGAVSLTPAVDQVAAPQARSGPVSSAALTCPGPETEGLQGVPAVPGTTTVYAASPPTQALDGLAAAPGSGTVSVATAPAGASLAQTDRPAAIVTGTLTGATAAQVAATGPLAAAVAALQTTLVTDGDSRALVSAPCLVPQAELWLVAGGGGSTRRERVVLTNPGANTVLADVSVLGGAGLLPSSNGRNVSVPPRGRASLFVDALVGPENTPVVHVVASGGVLGAVLEDSWVEGATGRGADDTIPAADPGQEQVVSGVVIDGPARLRVGVPGTDETVVQARALTKDGPVALPGDGVLRVPGSSVRELDLSAVPAGAYAIQVRADHPVVAGVMVERRGTGPQSDFGWTTSTDAISDLAGTPLPAGAAASLLLTSTGGAGTASVYTVDEAGAVTVKPYAMGADSIQSVDVSGARQVWVRRTTGTLRAAVSLGLQPGDPQPLYSVVPLVSGVVSATQVPVRQIPG